MKSPLPQSAGILAESGRAVSGGLDGAVYYGYLLSV